MPKRKYRKETKPRKTKGTFERVLCGRKAGAASAIVRRKRIYEARQDPWYWHLWLYSRVEGNPDGCWNFTGGKTKEGYGQIGIDKKSHLAHRVSFKITNGYLPDDKLVCHHCDNPSCINPQHLFLGTNRDNVHDSINKGRRHCQKVKSL